MKALVDVVPVLGDIYCAETEMMLVVLVVGFGVMDICHRIDHNSVCLQGVGALKVFLVVDVTLNPGNVFAEKQLFIS